jgi:hypothetical protein
VEAVLLPSPEIKALSERAVVAAARRSDAICAELRQEFGVPYMNSFVIVLNAKGETLASFMGDTAGRGCTKESCDKFGSMLAAKIEECLKRTESVQELRRRFDTEPGSEAALDALVTRLEEVYGFSEIVTACERAASNPDLPREKRDGLRIRGLQARSRDRSTFTGQGRAKFAVDVEKLLIEAASHPSAKELARTLFQIGYSNQFDVPTKTRAGVERLKAALIEHRDPLPLKERIQELTAMFEEWSRSMETRMKSLPEGERGQSARAVHAAHMGDAATTIEVFTRPQYKSSIYAEWVKEARAKLEREF